MILGVSIGGGGVVFVCVCGLGACMWGRRAKKINDEMERKEEIKRNTPVVEFELRAQNAVSDTIWFAHGKDGGGKKQKKPGAAGEESTRESRARDMEAGEVKERKAPEDRFVAYRKDPMFQSPFMRVGGKVYAERDDGVMLEDDL